LAFIQTTLAPDSAQPDAWDGWWPSVEDRVGFARRERYKAMDVHGL
jgi:hypothetical protein